MKHKNLLSAILCLMLTVLLVTGVSAAKLLGDVNNDGKITSDDARTVLRISVGLDTISDSDFYIADINGDGQITSADARTVLRTSVGLDKTVTHTHTAVTDPALEATCTDTGLTEGLHCSVCNEVLTEQKLIPAKGHTFNSEITKAATCQTKGIQTDTCSVCGYSTTKTLDALGHKWVAATCTSARKCERCGETSGKALGHQWNDGEITKAATCKATGVLTYTCEVCKATKTETIFKSSEHTWDGGKVTTSATCTDKGIITYTCTVCKTTKTEETAPTGHKLAKIAKKEATTEAEGNIEYYHCSLCGKNFSDSNANTEVSDVTIPKITGKLTQKDIYNAAIKYTVEINVDCLGYSATGTGFFIDSDGTIATNYHVIANALDIRVTTYDGSEYACTEIIGYDEDIDVAKIKVDFEPETIATLAYTYETADTVYTLGSSNGLSYTFSDGMISNKERVLEEYNIGNDVAYIQISAPISSGNSGGPLINDKGQVIGINSASLSTGQNLNFALPVKYLDSLTAGKMTAEEYYTENNSVTIEKMYSKAVAMLNKYGTDVDGEALQIYSEGSVDGWYAVDAITYWNENGYISFSAGRINETTGLTVNNTVYIQADGTITCQFVYDGKYAYYTITPDSFDPDGKVTFYSNGIPFYYMMRSEAEQTACALCAEALEFADYVFNYYGYPTYMAALGYAY